MVFISGNFPHRQFGIVRRLYNEHGYGEWGEKLYLSLADYRFLTLQTWQWAALLALFIFVYMTIFVPDRPSWLVAAT